MTFDPGAPDALASQAKPVTPVWEARETHTHALKYGPILAAMPQRLLLVGRLARFVADGSFHFCIQELEITFKALAVV